MQLFEFEIIPIAPTTVKGQAIADLLAWFPREESWDVIDEVLGDLLELGGFLDLMGPPLLLKEELE